MQKNETSQVTRGFGLLEGFLAKKRSRRANQLIPHPLRTGRILDIGCGSYPYFLAETAFQEKYGIDKSVTTTEESLHLQQWDFGEEPRLPFENNFFTVVTMLAVFEHIDTSHLRVLVSEIHRVLKPGGCFILTTPAGWTDRLLRAMARVKLVSPVEINDHKDTYSHKKVSGILVDGGFKKDAIRLGYFECFMNIWAVAGK